MAETVLSNAVAPSGLQPGNVLTGQTPPDPAPDTGGIAFPENWKDTLPEEIRNAESLKVIHNWQDLAKGYVHAQKAMGADKIPVPSKHATAEDWRGVYKKLGLPESEDKYEIKPKADLLDDEFLGEYKKAAYGANILPQQAQALLDWYVDKSGSMLNAQQETEKASVAKAVSELQAEFGQAYVDKITVAKNVLTEVGGEELAQTILNSPVANDPNVIRLLVKTAELLKDDPVRGQAVHGLGSMSPAEAQSEIAKLQGDVAYLDNNHPGHANAVAEMQRLFKIVYPE